MHDEIRKVIRELLREELATLRSAERSPEAKSTREERVSINTDAELAAFVQRLLKLAANETARADLQAGRHVFRLSRGASRVSDPVAGAGATSIAQHHSGLFSERDVKRLASGVNVVKVGANVRFTPLATDELRRLGIKIERTKP